MKRLLLIGAAAFFTGLGGCGDDTSPEPGTPLDVADDTAAGQGDEGGETDHDAELDVPAPEDLTEPEDALPDAEPAPDDAADASDEGPALDEGQVEDTGPPPTMCPEPCALDALCVDGQCTELAESPCPGGCPPGLYCNELAEPTPKCQSSECSFPTQFANPVQKMDFLAIPDGNQGCDLTGDGEPDNVLGAILKLMGNANTSIELLILNGDFTMVIETPGFNVGGDPFTARGMPGELAQPGCSPTAPDANCNYTLWDSGFVASGVGTCEPSMVFKQVVAEGNKMMSLGNKDIVDITLPLLGPVPVKIPVHLARMTADITWSDGVLTSTTNGVLCGAVPLWAIEDIIDNMPDELFEEAGLPKTAAKEVVKTSLDMDINGDGWPDSLSSAAWFSTVPGTVIGMN